MKYTLHRFFQRAIWTLLICIIPSSHMLACNHFSPPPRPLVSSLARENQVRRFVFLLKYIWTFYVLLNYWKWQIFLVFYCKNWRKFHRPFEVFFVTKEFFYIHLILMAFMSQGVFIRQLIMALQLTQGLVLFSWLLFYLNFVLGLFRLKKH